MKKFKKIFIITISTLLVVGTFLYYRLQPVFELNKLPVYKGNTNFEWNKHSYDPSKKTVVIIADNDGTEMFDCLAPFYLFNASGMANVYIIAEKKAPVVMAKGLFILPSFGFSEIDSLKIKPDVIVIPNQSIAIDKPQKASTVNWIKEHYTGKNIILSVCDGSATAAATGLYDSKPITTHASDFNKIRKLYPKAGWVNNVSVTQSGNLFSTAGVSNATEGSLAVINYLFGRETMLKVLNDIEYPFAEIKTDHKSIPLGTDDILTVLKKVIFKRNNKIGVLLSDSINEFKLAGLLDTYIRTVPSGIETLILNGFSVTSKYGLTMYPTGIFNAQSFDEIHVLMPELITVDDKKLLAASKLVTYNHKQAGYPIDNYLIRIGNQYGTQFKGIVKVMLDFNWRWLKKTKCHYTEIG
ncbi:MAG: DJ-1/PfpI family protein [Ginsengibacter sp.]